MFVKIYIGYQTSPRARAGGEGLSAFHAIASTIYMSTWSPGPHGVTKERKEIYIYIYIYNFF